MQKLSFGLALASLMATACTEQQSAEQNAPDSNSPNPVDEVEPKTEPEKQQEAFVFEMETAEGSTLVCADINERGLAEAASWVTGFVTGMNAADSAMVGQTTTTSGLLGEVKLHCEQHPSDTLMNASYATYQRLKKQGK